MLEFLKKHYEKVILVFLLILFILSMIYLLGAIDSSRSITDADLSIQTRGADYEQVNPKDRQFVDRLFVVDNITWASKNLDKSKIVSDLVWMFPSGRCSGCNYIIPLSIMEKEGDCPFCGLKLKKPERSDVEGDTETIMAQLNDMDGDGIPNDVEKEAGLNMTDKSDAMQSKNNDGFSNLFKHRNNIDLKGNAHPPLYMRLAVLGVGKVPLPYILRKVEKAGSVKSRWLITLENTISHKKTTDYLSNISVRIGDAKYSGIDVAQDAQGNDYLVLESRKLVNGEKPLQNMYLNKEVRSSDERAQLFDTGNGEVHTLEVGKSLTLTPYCGPGATPVFAGKNSDSTSGNGVETYRVTSIDGQRGVVTLQNVSTNEVVDLVAGKDLIPRGQQMFKRPKQKLNK